MIRLLVRFTSRNQDKTHAYLLDLCLPWPWQTVVAGLICQGTCHRQSRLIWPISSVVLSIKIEKERYSQTKLRPSHLSGIIWYQKGKSEILLTRCDLPPLSQSFAFDVTAVVQVLTVAGPLIISRCVGYKFSQRRRASSDTVTQFGLVRRSITAYILCSSIDQPWALGSDIVHPSANDGTVPDEDMPGT